MKNKFFTLITGATGGLGKAFCFKLASLNNNLLLTARNIDNLNKLKQDILKKYNVEIVCFACDLADFSSREKFFEFIKINQICVNFLINVAGVDTQKAFKKYTHEKIVFQTRVIFEGTISLTHFVLSQNFENLKILTISSICGIMPMPYFAIYSSQKSALISFFNAIRNEYKKEKVTITTILPSSIPTREDIKLDIKKQGLTGALAKKSPDYIVEKSLKALKKSKKNYIPGFYNKLVYFFSKLTPLCIKMKITSKKFAKKDKDAF